MGVGCVRWAEVGVRWWGGGEAGRAREASVVHSCRISCRRRGPCFPRAGKVHFQLPEGSVLTPGQLIARLDLDDPAAVRKWV